METQNLMILNDETRLVRFMKQYSSSEKDREFIIETLLKINNPYLIKKIERVTDATDNIRSIINEYFRVIGIEITD